MLSIKWIFIPAILLTLCSCAADFREHKYWQGYVVLRVEGERYRIEYFAKSKPDAAKYWKQTFEQLCQGNGAVIYEQGEVAHTDMYTPIMGQSVNIGRQKFHHIGIVDCNGPASDLIKITSSPWREFNSSTQQKSPVSEEYLLRKLNIFINHFSNLQPATCKALRSDCPNLGKAFGKKDIRFRNILQLE